MVSLVEGKRIVKRINVQTKKVKAAIREKHKARFNEIRERKKLDDLQRDFERVTTWDYIGEKKSKVKTKRRKK